MSSFIRAIMITVYLHSSKTLSRLAIRKVINFTSFFDCIFSLFAFQMLFPFQVSPLETLYPIPPKVPLWGCSSTNSPTPIFLPWHSSSLRHPTLSGSRASPLTDVQQGHPLLRMWQVPWVTPCVFFCWWSSLWELWELWEVWMDDTVAPSMGFQTLSAHFDRNLRIYYAIYTYLKFTRIKFTAKRYGSAY